MSTQYDGISKEYSDFKSFPAWEMINYNALHHIGDVEGLRCLDLACGLGDWARRLLARGATEVVGIDISPSMVERARQALSTDEEKAQIRFEVRDCGIPFEVDNGQYDFIFAGWLLNYAPDFATQVQMWRNIFNNLKPGGRFVTITPNTWCPMFEPFGHEYHVVVEALHPIKDGKWEGTCVRNTMLTKPKSSSFETYYWLHDFYEAAAAEGGLKDVKWKPTLPPEGALKDEGFWDIWMMRPAINILTARKPA